MAGPTRELRVPRPGDLTGSASSPAQTPGSPKPEASGGWFTREESESAGTRVNPYAAERAEASSESAASHTAEPENPASGEAASGAPEGPKRTEDDRPAGDASTGASTGVASDVEPVNAAEESPAPPPAGDAPASRAEAGETASGEAEAPRGDDDTGPVPVVRAEDEGDRSGTVKVIVGTRRFHSATCPLVKGAGDSGVESMTAAAAEAAGLTSCSVCQHERESVG
ncbi:hypothetical protein ACIBH1_09045 [Nonomuraea sp. NPDC050663]|uniref:hypothetical protein n=1 Tax=Nonomuraea sp. NPDC050663 TaxID=3364370 RepID=UPI0037B6F2D6